MKEEKSLIEKIGKKNSFTVPEGYFDSLTDKIMAELPEKSQLSAPKKEVNLWERVKPFAYLAAMFVGAALIIQLFTNEVVLTEDEDELYNEYIDLSYSQTMFDDYSLSLYLEENEEELNY